MGFNFDPSKYDAPDTFDVLPGGEYEVVVTKAEFKQNKAKTGDLVELRLSVISGPHEKRMLFDRCNINNPNETAQRIGRGVFKTLCESTGVGAITDPETVCDIPVIAVVKVTEDPTYGKQNQVTRYKPSPNGGKFVATQDKTPFEAGGNDVPPPSDDDASPI